MNRKTKLRAQIALTTAICFASLATFAVHSPAASESRTCDPWWAISWAVSDCR